MKYFIALDSGGYKTESVLFSEDGTVLAFERERGANAFDVGPEEAGKRICSVVDALMARLPEGEKLSGVFGSISVAFYYPEIEERVKRHVGKAKCRMDQVVCSPMAAVLGKDDGVCLISGTGSYCCVRQKGKHRHYIGSSGYMLDTGGSGFVLGRQALIAAQRERDGRGPSTLLTQILEAEMGETLREHLPAIYAGGRAYISSFSPAVFAARRQGDAVAAKIFNDAVDYYEEALQTAYRIMGQPYRGVLAGGVFINVPEYAKAVCDRAPEGCTLQVIDTPTLYGAALEAMWLTDEEIPEGFKARFVETFAQVRGKEADWQ
ncbi:MAG: hypothetical protein IKM82_01165 [Oscillospiraceae bacterium]|nr:hypothetical protein [Oscillospiraceae bacterium]